MANFDLGSVYESVVKAVVDPDRKLKADLMAGVNVNIRAESAQVGMAVVNAQPPERQAYIMTYIFGPEATAAMMQAQKPGTTS